MGPHRERLQASRRGIIGSAAAAATVAIVPRTLAQQTNPNLGTPPSVITSPPQQWGASRAAGHLSRSRHHHHRPVVQVAPARHHGHSSRRDRLSPAEGPAWCSEGQYLVFSDVQANIQYRFETRSVEDEGDRCGWGFADPITLTRRTSFAGFCRKAGDIS